MGAKSVLDLPYTITYIIRKRRQLDSFAELPQEKRPPEHIIWSHDPTALERWFDKVFKRKKEEKDDGFYVDIDEIE